jgi:hypothetical protein
VRKACLGSGYESHAANPAATQLRPLSQGRAAEIAGLTRANFINALSRYQVSPFQYTADEIAEELRDAH